MIVPSHPPDDVCIIRTGTKTKAIWKARHSSSAMTAGGSRSRYHVSLSKASAKAEDLLGQVYSNGAPGENRFTDAGHLF